MFNWAHEIWYGRLCSCVGCSKGSWPNQASWSRGELFTSLAELFLSLTNFYHLLREEYLNNFLPIVPSNGQYGLIKSYLLVGSFQCCSLWKYDQLNRYETWRYCHSFKWKDYWGNAFRQEWLHLLLSDLIGPEIYFYFFFPGSTDGVNYHSLCTN